MNTKRIVWTSVIGMGLLLGAGLLGAQADDTGNTSVSATAQTVQRLELDTHSIDFGTLGAGAYDQGSAERANAQQLTVMSNVPWQVTVQADAETFAYDGAAEDPAKPASDLRLASSSDDPRVTSALDYTGLSGSSDTQVASGDRGGGIDVATSYKVLLDYDEDPAGDYAIGVTYTLSTQ